MNSTIHTGYLSEAFAQSYRSFGEIITLPQSGIPLLKREIDENHFDLAGHYPYTMSTRWSALREDEKFLRNSGAVSVVFVSDPFARDEVARATTDWNVSRDFKTHYVVDLKQDWRNSLNKEERRYRDLALESHSVQEVEIQEGHAKELWLLYQNTIKRHSVTGIAALSQEIIEHQLKVSGSVLIEARHEDHLVGAFLAYQHGLTGNSHLIFAAKKAYKLKTSYALYHFMLEAFEARGCRFFNFGGAAGVSGGKTDGLARFKRKWSNCERTSMLCGMVLNEEAYSRLTAATGRSSEFFPAYRA